MVEIHRKYLYLANSNLLYKMVNKMSGFSTFKFYIAIFIYSYVDYLSLFIKWCQETGKLLKFEELPVDELCQLLREFYASVQRVDGESYSKSSLCNIGAGIQSHIASPPYNRFINIIWNASFQQANNVLDGLLKNQKREKKDTTSELPADLQR